MNPLIAILVGMLLAYALVRKNGDASLGWWRPVAGGVGAFLPYFQFLFAVFGSGVYWQMYQGPTWSLLLLPPMVSLATVVLARVSRQPFAQLIWPLGIGMLGSIVLGMVTEEGVFPLALLMRIRVALGLLPNFDVVILALGILTLASLFVFRAYQRDIARLGLICMAGYLCIPLYHAFEAHQFAKAYVRTEDLQEAHIHVLPQPLSVQNWRVIVEDGGGRVHDTLVNLSRKEVLKATSSDTRTRRIDALYRPKNQAIWRVYRRFGEADFNATDARRVERAWEAWKNTPYFWLGRYSVFEQFVAVPDVVNGASLCVQFMDLRRDGARREEKGQFVICPGEGGMARVFRPHGDGRFTEWNPLLGV